MNNLSTFSSYNPPSGTPMLNSTQIAFGDGSNLMTSSTNLTFDNIGETLRIEFGGDNYFKIDHGNNLYGLGDLSSATNGNQFVVDNTVASLAYYDNSAHTGLFGINTSTPSVALDLVGAARFKPILDGVDDFTVFNDAGHPSLSIDNVSKLISFDPDVVGYKVGIGTLPSVALDVNASNTGVLITSDTYTAGLFKVNEDGTWFIGNRQSNKSKIDGNIGAQTIEYIASGGHDFSDGTVLIDNLSGTGTRAVLADSSGVLSAPVSDISVKENIQPLDYGLSELMQLKPVSFEFIEGWKNFGEGKQIGFIAQQVAEVIPEATFTTAKTGKMGINKEDIISVLVKAVQELKAEVDQLKAQLNK